MKATNTTNTTPKYQLYAENYLGDTLTIKAEANTKREIEKRFSQLRRVMKKAGSTEIQRLQGFSQFVTAYGDTINIWIARN